MVLAVIMRNTIKIFAVLTFIFSMSCEEQGLFVKCPDCLKEDPIQTTLDIKLDAPYSGIDTQINVYEGNIEDSVLYSSFKTTSSHTTTVVNLNKKYTVTATYYIPDNYYIAIDSATPKVKYDKSKCDDPCYFIYDKVIDLRLKYTK
jgi:hypothetical protein